MAWHGMAWNMVDTPWFGVQCGDVFGMRWYSTMGLADDCRILLSKEMDIDSWQHYQKHKSGNSTTIVSVPLHKSARSSCMSSCEDFAAMFSKTQDLTRAVSHQPHNKYQLIPARKKKLRTSLTQKMIILPSSASLDTQTINLKAFTFTLSPTIILSTKPRLKKKSRGDSQVSNSKDYHRTSCAFLNLHQLPTAPLP